MQQIECRPGHVLCLSLDWTDSKDLKFVVILINIDTYNLLDKIGSLTSSCQAQMGTLRCYVPLKTPPIPAYCRGMPTIMNHGLSPGTNGI